MGDQSKHLLGVLITSLASRQEHKPLFWWMQLLQMRIAI